MRELDWDAYLDSLEESVLAVDAEVMSGRSPGWFDVKVPAGPIPPRLRVRGEVLLALLHDVTERTVLQRDDLAAELASIPHRRPQNNAYLAHLGSHLDVLS